jgi:hypothetical protein
MNQDQNILIKTKNHYVFHLKGPVYGYTRLIDGQEPKNHTTRDWFVSPTIPQTFTDSKQTNELIEYRLKAEYDHIKEFEKSKPVDTDFVFEHDDLASLYEPVYELINEIGEPQQIIWDQTLEEDIEEPLEFTGHGGGWGSSTITINPRPSLMHMVLYPKVVLPSKPCAYSSEDMYNIVRQHIKTNIDTHHAKITSDYNFCFTVKKVLKHIKKDEKTPTRPDVEYEIFEMTNDKDKYKGYSIISGITARNHKEMKRKVEHLLNNIMRIVNEPIAMCQECEGTGTILPEKFKMKKAK